MSRSRFKSADHVHYTSGVWDTLRWMGYWAASRSGNTGRTFRRHWRSEVRPTFAEQSGVMKEHVGSAFRSGTSTHAPAYKSLADAVRHRQPVEVRG